MDKSIEFLSQNPIFNRIEPKTIEKLFGKILYRIKSFSTGEHVVFANEPVHNLMFILQGSVRGEMTDYSGKVIKIEDIEAPRPVAPAFIFGKQNRYPVDIIANEPSTVLVLPKESLIKLLQENAVLLNNFLDVISNRAQFLSERIRFLNFKTIKGKIAYYILKNSGSENKKVTINSTQSQLADFFGVTRPSYARALGEIIKDGILEMNKKEITILDRKKLAELIQ